MTDANNLVADFLAPTGLRQRFIDASIKPGTSKAVDLPTLGTIYIPRLSIRDAENAAKAIKGADAYGSAAALIVAIVQDETGKRVFTDDDIAMVAGLPADIGGAIIAAYEAQNGAGHAPNA